MFALYYNHNLTVTGILEEKQKEQEQKPDSSSSGSASTASPYNSDTN